MAIRMLLLLLALGATGLASGFFVQRVAEAYRQPFGFDLLVFAQAGRQFWETGQLYDRSEPLADTYRPGARTFKFPPAHQLFLAPWLAGDNPQRIFRDTWTILLGLYGLSCVLLLRLGLQQLRHSMGTASLSTDNGVLLACLVFALGLAFPPFFFAFGLQASEITLLCLTLATFCLAGRQPVLAGFLLAWAIAAKLYPAFLLLHFLLLRQWRVIGSCLLSCVLIGLISLAVFGLEENLFYLRQVLPILLREAAVDHPENISLAYGLLSLTQGWGPVRAETLTLTAKLMLLAVGAIVLYACRHILQREQPLLFAAVLITMLLMLNNRWMQYDLFLLPAMVLITARLLAERQIAGLLGLLALLVWLSFELSWLRPLLDPAAVEQLTRLAEHTPMHTLLWQHHKPLWLAWLLHSSKPLITVVLWLACLTLLWQIRKPLPMNSPIP